MSEAIGKFQVLGTLGQGAHSSILRVRRASDSKQYALKIVPISGDEEIKFLEQAEHEFRVAQKLDHPNLIKVYALEKLKKFGFFGGIREVRLLIEFVQGKTLDAYQNLPLSRQVQIFAKVAAGLAHMHRRNIYHADLKPNNIMLSRTGDVKILDYGLAWFKGERKDRVQGTPEYMAPEQVLKRVVNEKTDIFNLGATMYRMVANRHVPTIAKSKESGTLSFKGKQWEAQIKPVKACNAETPDGLADLIHRCLAYNPNERPEFVTDVQAGLEKLVEEVVHSSSDRLEAMEWQEQ